MAVYEINGKTYEVPDTMKGAELTATLQKLKELSGQPSGGGDSRMQKLTAYLDETDRLVGLPSGTSYRQIKQESQFKSEATSPRGAMGIAQVMPAVQASLEKKLKRKLDPRNDDDALLIHREVMTENIGKFKTPEGAIRAYNAGWKPEKWDNKETNDYVATVLGPTKSPAAAKPAYKPYAQVRKDIDPATLANDPDWLKASKQIYALREKKDFVGSAEDLSVYGQQIMSKFNFNMINMTAYAHDVINNGTQEDKEAFLYMMDTYDNTNVSINGVGRAIKGLATDPLTYVGLGTLGLGTAAKASATTAAKVGTKKLLINSLGRTGIIAGVEGGIYAGTQNAVNQGVEISAGRIDSMDLGRLAGATTLGVGAGVVLGTAADAALTSISGMLQRRASQRSGAGAVPGAAGADAVPPVGAAADEAVPVEAAVPGATPDPAPGAAPNPAPGPQRADNNLTDAELEVATGRKQKGRLPEDDALPVDNTRGIEIEVPPRNTGLRTTVQNMEELTEMGGQVADQLRGLDDRALTQTLESLRFESRPLEESRVVARGIQILADELRVEQAQIIKKINLDPNHPQVPALQQRLAEIENRLPPLGMADDAFGSMSGSILRQRQEGLPGLQGITIESLMADGRITRAQAETEFVRLVEASKNTVEAQKVIDTYDRAIQDAIDAGNIGEAGRLAAMRQTELEADVPVKATSGWFEKLNELAISNVFTPTTIMINMVPSGMKTLVLPALRALVSNPLEKATRVEAAASYSAMRASVGGAMRAARAAFKYERAMLTRDVSNLLEGDMAIEGAKGGYIRIFPRILNATDEFLGHLNYNGYVAGRAGAEAAIEGGAKGMTGEALDAFIKQRIATAIDGAFKTPTGTDLVQPIINKGVKLGYTGEDLARYVQMEAIKDPEALRHGSDKEALDFVRDVLYKRSFSGEGVASKAAVGYEQMMTKVPALRFVLGQLFFRTPIRVFEEGVRLTPGLQILAPNFLADLAGKNGVQRQVRAQGESLASLAVAGMVLTLYSEGKLKGSGAYDNFRQNKLRSDTDLPDAYTLKMDDGSTWSFRGFDPIAVPVKMMVNGFEQLDRLTIREAQGEFIDAETHKKALASVSAGTMAIAAAFRDANLVSGLGTSLDFFKDLKDPEGRETATLKLMGERLKVLVPNTMHKIAKTNDPRIVDPATFWQVVDSRLTDNNLNREDIKTSFSYDVLGNTRTPADTGALWNIFSTATAEERGRGKSKEALETLAEMDRLSQVTGAVFSAPLKHEMTGELDLRTILTTDKSETLYDRWQRKYAALNPDQVLHPIATAPLPDGTFKVQGMKAEALTSTIKQLRDAAFTQMLAEEPEVIERVVKTARNQLESKAGLNDIRR